MSVVAAGVHDAWGFGCVCAVCLFSDWERVGVSAECDGALVCVFGVCCWEVCEDSGASCEVWDVLDGVLAEVLDDEVVRAVFLVGEFGVCVDVSACCDGGWLFSLDELCDAGCLVLLGAGHLGWYGVGVACWVGRGGGRGRFCAGCGWVFVVVCAEEWG